SRTNRLARITSSSPRGSASPSRTVPVATSSQPGPLWADHRTLARLRRAFLRQRERDRLMAQGFTRFRKIQVGKQSVIGTAVAATRVLPYRSLVVYNPNRTDPDIDVGSLDLVLSPYAVAPEVTLPGAIGPLTFNDLAIRASAGIMGGITPTGNAVAGFTWTFQPASLTADVFDYYSVQTGDDTSDSA